MTDQEFNPAAPLNARLSELVNYASEVREQLESLVESIPASQRELRAAPDVWSVAENIEHLCMIEDSVGRLISSMAKQLHADNALEVETNSMLGALDQYQVPANAFKLVAPEPFRPSGTLTCDEAMEKLRSVRARVLQGVQKANGLDLTKATFPHPFFGPINGYQWLLLIGQHELRHVNQMRKSVQQLTGAPAVPGSDASQQSL